MHPNSKSTSNQVKSDQHASQDPEIQEKCEQKIMKDTTVNDKQPTFETCGSKEDVPRGNEQTQPTSWNWGFMQNMTDFVKKDLEEFQHNASSLANDVGGMFIGMAKSVNDSIPSDVKQEVRKASDVFFTGVNNVINTLNEQLLEDEEYENETLGTLSTYVEEISPDHHSEFRLELYKLQKNEDTYVRPPECHPEEFDSFISKIQDEIDQLKIENKSQPEAVMHYYHLLVPKELSHQEFWARYKYNINLLIKNFIDKSKTNIGVKSSEESKLSPNESNVTSNQDQKCQDQEENEMTSSLSSDSFQLVDGPGQGPDSKIGCNQEAKSPNESDFEHVNPPDED